MDHSKLFSVIVAIVNLRAKSSGSLYLVTMATLFPINVKKGK